MRLTATLALGLFAACGSMTPAAPDDAGTVDAGREDAGDLDTGLEDAGNEDGDYDGGEEQGYDAGADAPDEDAGIEFDGGVAPPEVTVVERTVRVLHWNIAGGKENDCRGDLIARAVRRFAVDENVEFIGLNEVCPSQHEAIREALRDAWNLGPNFVFSAYQGDNLPRVVGNAIYSKRGLANVVRQKLGSDQYGDRFLLCGRVTNDPHLRFCSAHL
ncbi:MAG: endonuclease/exonuclease/phosphatase family protein, partial [Archangium sp.]